MSSKLYVNAHFDVQLTEEEHGWYEAALRAFDAAYRTDKAYIDYPLGAVIFVPDALREHGTYYPAAERLRLSNLRGYEYLLMQLRKYERKPGVTT